LFNKQAKIKTEKDDKNILVTQFHPTDDSLREIINNNWDLLGKNTNTTFLHKNKPTVGYKRPPNLRDLLMKAEVRSKNEIAAQKLREKTEKNQKLNIHNIQFPDPDNKLKNTSNLI
jgi:hypothetical protein